MLSSSICSRSLFWGERNNGSMLTRPLWTLGTNVPRRSSRSSSRRAKPMLFVVGFQTSSRHQMSQFRRLGRLQEYILACPHHGMDNWLILQNFYNGLTQSSRDHLDAAAGGAFFSLTIERATSLIEKIVSNQGWSNDRLQPRQRGMHSVKEADMLAMKIDFLLKKFEDYSQDKAQMQILQAWKLA